MFIGIFRILQTRSSNDDDFQSLSRSNRFEFGIFLDLQLIALICFILNFLQFHFRRDFRQSLSYDMIFIRLFSSFIFDSIVLSLSQANIINLFLMAFVSIERYLFVFYSFLFHYSPILFCIYFIHLSFLSKHVRLLTILLCYFGRKLWANIDLFINNYTSLLIILLFCSFIYLRVFCQRRSMQLSTMKWGLDKRFICQLLVISSLYLSM